MKTNQQKINEAEEKFTRYTQEYQKEFMDIEIPCMVADCVPSLISIIEEQQKELVMLHGAVEEDDKTKNRLLNIIEIYEKALQKIVEMESPYYFRENQLETPYNYAKVALQYKY